MPGEYMDWLEFTVTTAGDAFTQATINVPIPPAAFSKYQKALAMIIHEVQVEFQQVSDQPLDVQTWQLTKLSKAAMVGLNTPDLICKGKRANITAVGIDNLIEIQHLYPPTPVVTQQIYFGAQCNIAGAANSTINGRIGFTLREVPINQAWSAVNNF